MAIVEIARAFGETKTTARKKPQMSTASGLRSRKTAGNTGSNNDTMKEESSAFVSEVAPSRPGDAYPRVPGDSDADRARFAAEYEARHKDDYAEDNAKAAAAGKPKSLKSYWYPDRTANMGAVSQGFAAAYARATFLFIGVLVAFALIIYVGKNDLSVFWLQLLAGYDALVDSGLLVKHETLLTTLAMFCAGVLFLVMAATWWWSRRGTPVYIIDFALFQPPDSLKCPKWKFLHVTKLTGYFDDEAVDFQEKLLCRTGLGEETYFPEAMFELPVRLGMDRARDEALMVLSGCMDSLMEKTGITPKDIDILIINCSLFNPTPSLTAMVMNKYKMRSDVRNYNLAGMGCSAGVISIDLAKDLLQVYQNVNVVVLSTENITQNWYLGKDKGKLVSNTLFRVGGAGILLSNKIPSWRAKYRLKHLVRVNKAADDTSYKCVFQEQDAEGNTGVTLSKDLLKVAGAALKENITILGPMVLPYSEQIKFFLNLLGRRFGMIPRDKAYVPDFKKAFEHFCIHAGGRAIIDGLEENFKLEPHHTEPSRATLYRYGNTSSSSIWYELQFIELSGRIKRGDRVFQIALGSGFKCNSAVWEKL